MLKAAVRDFVPSVSEFYRIKSKFQAGIMVPSSPQEIVRVGVEKLGVQQMSCSGLGQMAGGPLGGWSQVNSGVSSRWNPENLCRKIDLLSPHFRLAQISESVRKVSYWITQFSEHETYGGEAYESHRHGGEVLKILGEAAASIEPCESSLDDPPARQDFEPFGCVRALHDRDGKPGQGLRQRVTEFRALISAVGEEFLKERIKPEHGLQDICPSVTVLDVRRMNDRVQQQSYRIDQDVPLLSLDLLARVVAIRVDAGPPFSALFTLWLSITQAVGLASRPICSRHSMYRAW
jgi:hypothetical protein